MKKWHIVVLIVLVVCFFPENHPSNTFDTSNIIAGLFGIAIGLIYRQTEFKKYFLQKQIEEFSSFLSKVEICRRNTLTSIVQSQLSKPELDINQLPRKTTKLLWPFIEKKYSVKLLLSKQHKEVFEKVIKEIQSLTIAAHMSNEYSEIGLLTDKFALIENLFSESIDNTKKMYFL